MTEQLLASKCSPIEESVINVGNHNIQRRSMVTVILLQSFEYQILCNHCTSKSVHVYNGYEHDNDCSLLDCIYITKG